MPEEESGFDELMRLSQQFTRQQEENEEKERQREAQGKKLRGVLQGLKDLNVSMAIEQLKTVATPEIIKKVNALKTREGTDDLRKMISALADDLEKSLNAISASKLDTAPLINSMRTLNILMDLYFSLH
jgi:ribosomal protein L22